MDIFSEMITFARKFKHYDKKEEAPTPPRKYYDYGCRRRRKALARIDEMVVFVPFAAPGDVVDLQVRRKKHHYCEAEIVRFIKQSNIRQTPMCGHFGICGGCKWQHLPYNEQLKAKQKQVYDQLTRIGKVELPEFRPIMGSVKVKEYRNKLEFGCSNKRWLTRAQVASVGLLII